MVTRQASKLSSTDNMETDKLQKETLDSWYEPRVLDNPTEKEEKLIEEEFICDSCGRVECTCDDDTMEFMDQLNNN